MDNTAIEIITQIRTALKNGEYSLPNNAEELRVLSVYFGWNISFYEAARKRMFPTPEENAALSAKFMKMM
jgi:hypothetical protein